MNVAGWKFDAVLAPTGRQQARLTCYAAGATRGVSLDAVFARYPGSTIFGTGMPLTECEVVEALGRPQAAGEVLLVDDLGELGP